MTYTWPHDADWVPMGSSFNLMTRAKLSTSPYTGASKAATLAQLWVADLSFNKKSEGFVREMQGFLNMLEGPANPVRLFDWWRELPLLVESDQPFSDGTFFSDGTGWVDGYDLKLIAAVAKGDNRFTVQGFPASTEVLRRGDLLGMQGYLYETRYGVTSNADGEALITVQPGARVAGAIGDPVTTWRPTVPMRLATEEAIIYRMLNAGEGFTLRFVEDIP